MTIAYNIALYSYLAAIKIASLFSAKAKQWIEGRKQTAALLKSNSLSIYSGCIWIHASSLGEFEQARPLIEKIKSDDASAKIVVTFYSPSGYEIRKNYPLADQVIYLPFDLSADIDLLISQLKPRYVLWIRYEFWYHTLQLLKSNNIPVFLISASFRKEQIFFKSYGIFFQNILKSFKHIFVINNLSQDLLQQININNCSKAADTRMDRVMTIASKNTGNPRIEKFLKNKDCLLVIGSSWAADIDLLCPFINQSSNAFIIAPHQIDEQSLNYIESKLTIPNIRYSQLDQKESTFEQVLIIDNIGMLASIYNYGKYAYIGGGFGVSVHNVLEAIVYHIPVLFGPNHQKQYECGELLKNDIAKVVYTSSDIKNHLSSMEESKNLYDQKCAQSKKYIAANSGGSDFIYHSIEQVLSTNNEK